MIQQFRKKPVVIEAVQWNGENEIEIYDFTKQDGLDVSKPPRFVQLNRNPTNDAWMMTIKTLEGNMLAEKMDWIIKGVNGEFYPCKPDIFEKTYEPA